MEERAGPVRRRVITILCGVSEMPLDPEGISGGDELASLGIDSLLLLHFVAELEREFAIEIADERLTPAAFRTVDAVVGVVDGTLASGPARMAEA